MQYKQCELNMGDLVLVDLVHSSSHIDALPVILLLVSGLLKLR